VYEVEEMKEIHDKALALEMYLRQAQNVEAERRCYEIRLRAEHKAGELLRQKKAKGAAQPGTNRGATPSPETRASTLADLSIR
jgi:parvulin-like peptidyl-prolyl isomerase